MKTIILLAFTFIMSLASSSFITSDPGIVESDYVVNDRSQVVDEAVLSTYEISTGRYGTMTVCPGTGVQCTIRLADDKDGDPVWLVSLKAKGKKNIEFLPL